MRRIHFGPATRGAFQRSGRYRGSETSRTGYGRCNGCRRYRQAQADLCRRLATVDSSGKIFTKESLLSDFKSGGHKLEWFENGSIDVQVFGGVAVAQGSVKEKRIDKGQDTSGQFVWMDLLRKRAANGGSFAAQGPR